MTPQLDPLSRWAAALGLFLAATALQLGVPAGRTFPFLAFFPAVTLCGWIAGRAPALAATAAAAWTAWWLLIRPPGLLSWPTPGQAAALAFFVCAGGLIAALADGLRSVAARAGKERDRAEGALLAELARTAELQHRTANMLQLVSSAMTLRMRNSGTDSETLADAARRLDALGQYNRRLLLPEAGEAAGDALADLARAQLSACASGRVALELDLQPGLRIEPSRLGILAMILGEGVSNALKHAFPQQRPGRLLIRLRRVDSQRLEMELRDDGIGLPEAFQPAEQQGAGLSIMRSLARQIDGMVTLASAPQGSVLRVVFAERGSPREA